LLRHVDKCPVCCPDMQAGVLLLWAPSCWTVACRDHSLLMVEHCPYSNSTDSLHNPQHCHLHTQTCITYIMYPYVLQHISNPEFSPLNKRLFLK
jgi:hypothetical protein